jgi:hypothetical protein
MSHAPFAALYFNMVACEAFNLFAVTFIVSPVVFL